MTRRRRISETRRAAIFLAAGGVCHICGAKIDAGREAWDVEHVLPLSMGGADEGDNLQPAHAGCHKSKTSAEAAPRAKAKRQERRTLGIRRQPRAIVPGSKASGWKKKLDGTVEKRK